MLEKRSDDMEATAYLYVSDELSEAERAAFEERLAVDQAARDAVADAVMMHAVLRGEVVRPVPSWRERVRARLTPSWPRRLLARRSYRGHPLAWAFLGAAAALLLSLTVLRPSPEVRWIEQEPIRVPVSLDLPEPSEDDPEGMSFVWAELSTPDHATRAADDENRRKSRLEDRRQTRRTPRAVE